MQFYNPLYENEELTYSDVFLFQNYFDGKSRISDVDITPKNKLNTTLPLISANMNAVTGKRMAETLARYGGLWVLPQDMSIEKMLEIVSWVKTSHTLYDTPLTVSKDEYVRDALSIIGKRAHNCVILVDDDHTPLGLFTTSDLQKYEQFTLLWDIPSKELIVGTDGITPEDAYNLMESHSISSLPILKKNGSLLGILTKKDAVRSGLYTPNLDTNGKLNIAVALGINHFLPKAKALIEAWVDIFILDTAHGYQKSMIDAIQTFRKEFWSKICLIAGNIITPEWVQALLEAWADGIKVWVGPGSMCTTRMMTGVGRPQFSAVYHCAKQAREMGGFIIADGGIKDPRDLALALAAGASHIMIGSILTGTFESTWDIFYDSEWLPYKKNYGMASGKAVNLRNIHLSPFEQAKKALFQEWISTSKIYLKSGMSSVGEVVDTFTTGLRSSLTYVGARNLEDFYTKAIIGVQTTAWFYEWTPHGKLKK